MRDRGRVTLPDLVFVLFSLAVLGALGPIVVSGIDDLAGSASTPTVYALRLLVPLASLVLLYSVYAKAVKGGTA
jgi:hypothetical protein